MLKQLQNILPGFLKRYDQHLLKNNPRAWATRLHIMAFFALIYLLFTICISLLLRYEPRSYDRNDAIVGSFSLVSFIGFVVWMIYLQRFNVFKKFGKEGKLAALKNFLAFFVGTALFILPVFIVPIVEGFVANKRYPDAMLIKDINEMNKLLIADNFNILPKKYNADTVKITVENYNKEEEKTTSDVVYTETALATADAAALENNNAIMATDYSYFKEQMQNADSVAMLSDTSFIAYSIPEVRFINNYSYNLDFDIQDQFFDNDELFKNYLLNKSINPQKPDPARLSALLEKYKMPNSEYYATSENDKENNFYAYIFNKYQLQPVQSALDNIGSKKSNWEYSKDDYARVTYYLSLTAALLIFILRHSTIKNFFWSLLTGFVLFCLIAIFANLLRIADDIPMIVLGIYAIAAIISLNIPAAKYRNTLQGIALNLFTFGTPFLPITVYVQWHSWKVRQNAEYYSNDFWPTLFIAELVGFVLIILLIEPLFKKLYRKWYALPDL